MRYAQRTEFSDILKHYRDFYVTVRRLSALFHRRKFSIHSITQLAPTFVYNTTTDESRYYYAPARPTAGGIKQCYDRSVRPSVRPSVPCTSSKQRILWLYTVLGNPTLEGEPSGHRETPFQKHSPGGCTIDMPPSNCNRRGHDIVLSRDILL